MPPKKKKASAGGSKGSAAADGGNSGRGKQQRPGGPAAGQGRGSETASAARAAAQATQVQLSADSETRLRRLIQTTGVGVDQRQRVVSNDLSVLERKQATRRLKNVYDSLAHEGFSASQIEEALRSLPPGEGTLEAALDWLCFHLPPDELPKKFSAGTRASGSQGGEVKVVLTARPDWKPAAKPEAQEDERKGVQAAAAVAARERKAAEEEKAAKAKQAAWIRRYMEQDEDEEEGEEGEDDEFGREEDDWEVWADPRERQRRKEQRQVAPEVRAVSAAAEFAAAKEMAALAKERGDKAKQAEAGRIIRELKEEMARLGLPDDVLYKAPTPPPAPEEDESSAMAGLAWDEDDEVSTDVPTAGTAREDAGKEPAGDREKDERAVGPAEGVDDVEDEGLGLFGEEESTGRAPVPPAEKGGLDSKGRGAAEGEKVGRAGEEEDEEVDVGGFFEEEAEGHALPESVLALKRKEERMVAWGSEESGKGKKTGGGKGKVAPQVEAQRTPKAVLQQHCQKSGWAAPKFEKLPRAVGSAWGGQFCYSVTVVRPTVGRGKNKQAGGPTTFQLAPDEDGFDTISDAQNAAATLALYSLVPDQPLYRVLPQTYRDMWLRWHDKGEATSVQEQAEEQTRRVAFISSLMTGSPSGDLKKVPSEVVTQRTQTEEAMASEPQLAGETGDTRRRLLAEGAKGDSESRRLLSTWQAKQKQAAYQAMAKKRAELPMAEVKEDLLAALRQHAAVVVSGETGSGKTTQVPQYIMDEMIVNGEGARCNIICTQPRRIAAVSVAERVAAERCEPPPGSNGSLVGYHVRLDACRSASTRLLFCTTGILLRRLAGDRDLADVSHVVVDEVHERTLQGDFLLVILRELVQRREARGLPPLKLVLMSATLDAAMFSHYFGDCPVISSKGRTHPVETHFLEDVYETLDYRLSSDSPAALRSYGEGGHAKGAKTMVGSSRGRQDLVKAGFGDEASLDEGVMNPYYDSERYQAYGSAVKSNLRKLNEDVIDYDLLEDLVSFIDENYDPGAILVFLPGIGEIQGLQDRLAGSRQFGGKGSHWLIPLHSSVAPADQKRAFQRPPEGTRKIVLATNIAETSVTIEDAVYVVDAGKLKESRFDPKRGMASLVEAWISRANARQRAGRAGRVRPGHCFALYTRHRLETLMHPYQLPEIQRVPLVELCLQIKLLGLGSAAAFLQKAIEPPKDEAVNSALHTLKEVGALNEEEELTALGHHLAALPVDVRIAKTMLYGAVFGCLSPALTVAACLSFKSPFFAPQDQKDAADRARQAMVAPRGEEGGDSAAAIARGQQSDHLAMVAAYHGWQEALQKGGSRGGREFCTKRFLSWQTLEMLRDMRQQFARLLGDIGFIAFPSGRWNPEAVDDPKQPWNRFAAHAPVLKAVLCAGLYPNVASMDEESIARGHAAGLGSRGALAASGRPRWSDGRVEVAVHPSSVNHPLEEFKRPFMVFHEKVKTSKVFLRDCTVVSPLVLLLFGGPITVQHQTGRVTVDGWLELRAPAQTGVLFKELRKALDAMLRDKIGRPQVDVGASSSDVIPAIVEFLLDEDKPRH